MQYASSTPSLCKMAFNMRLFHPLIEVYLFLALSSDVRSQQFIMSMGRGSISLFKFPHKLKSPEVVHSNVNESPLAYPINQIFTDKDIDTVNTDRRHVTPSLGESEASPQKDFGPQFRRIGSSPTAITYINIAPSCLAHLPLIFSQLQKKIIITMAASIRANCRKVICIGRNYA